MTVADRDIYDEAGEVSCDEAREIADRYNRSHFRERTPGEQARYSIPADPRRDDDIRLEAFIRRAEVAFRDLELLAKVRSDARLPELIIELDERYDYYEHRARIWGGHKLGDVTYAARREMVALVRALLSPGDAGRGEGGGT